MHGMGVVKREGQIEYGGYWRRGKYVGEGEGEEEEGEGKEEEGETIEQIAQKDAEDITSEEVKLLYFNQLKQIYYQEMINQEMEKLLIEK